MKPFGKFQILSLILAVSLILAACSGPKAEPTSSTPNTKGGEEDSEVVVEDENPAGNPLLVTSLADVKSAIIQIEAQGTFVDPEFGEYSGAGLGSGFIIDPSGLAITNNHVVTGAALLNVWVGGDTTKSYNAQILAVSECSDLALIDIEGDGFSYLEWYPDPITVGLEVYAAGFPLGDPEFTLTKGIVSKEQAGGESTWASVDHVIEHDATINPGNSGGPLVTDEGQVVGVNYASYAAAGQFFAIGADTTQSILKHFRTGDDVDSLGINGMAVMSDDGSLSGIWVSSVKSGTAADAAGVKPGDLLTTLEGLTLATDGSMATYCDIIRTQGDENTLSMDVLRFDTNETLEGQFNGRALSVTGTIGGGSQASTGGSTGGSTSSGYGSENILEVFDDGTMAITDDTYSLYVEVPSSWNEINGVPWSDTWYGIDFEAYDITVAPDLDAYWDSYAVPGMSFSASAEWGDIGGYIMLIDAVRASLEDVCEYGYRDDYVDQKFEGGYDYWECGNAGLYVFGVRPIADPTAYLMLLQIQVTSDADFEALELILATFDTY